MLDYLGYIVILSLVLLLASFFKVVTLCETKKMRRFFEIEKEKIDVTVRLKIKEHKYKEIENSLLQFPMIRKYLSQAELISNKYSYDFKGISIVRRNGKNESDWLDDKKFEEEFIRAPKKLRDEVCELSEIIAQIYSWEHPVIYRFDNFKKNLQMKILSLLIKVLESVISDRKRRRSKREELKKKEYNTSCRTVPVVVEEMAVAMG